MRTVNSIFFKYTNIFTLISYLVIRTILKIYFLVSPIIIMMLIDYAVAGDIDNFMKFAVISIMMFLLETVLQAFSDYFEGVLYTDNFIRVTNQLVKKAKYYDRNISDVDFDLQLSQNYELVSKYFFSVPITIIFSVVTIVSILAIVFYMSKTVAIILAIGAPTSIFLSNFLSSKVEDTTEQTALSKNKIKQFFKDCFILKNEDRFLKNKQLSSLLPLLSKYRKSRLKQERELSVINNVFVYGMLNLLILLVILVSGYNVLYGVLTIGMLNAFQTYTSQLWYPIESLVEIRREYIEKKQYINDLSRHLNLNEQNIDTTTIETIKLVNYQSKNNLNEALHTPLNATINNDEINVIIGDNGIGKTSLIHAIIGFSERYFGDIFINDKKNENDVYEDLVYVPANVYISELGSLEKFSTSSSGQQKLAQLEFSFTTNKSVYILDEPTNFLDTSKKDIVWESIKKLHSKNKMIIIVTNDDYLKNKMNTNIINIEKIH